MLCETVMVDIGGGFSGKSMVVLVEGRGGRQQDLKRCLEVVGSSVVARGEIGDAT